MLIFTSRWKPKQQPPPVDIVSWQNGTYDQIKAMLDAHDAGTINIYDYWNIGDTRSVSISAIAKNTNGAFTTAMSAQTVEMVLMNQGYMSQSGIHYVVGQKNELNQPARMNTSATNSGSWKSSKMRTDINDRYYNAVDSNFRQLIKPVNVLTAKTYSGSTNETVQDYFALFAEKEVLGTRSYSNTTEANALRQIKYYETSANRQKTLGNTSTKKAWWERSPGESTSKGFCYLRESGAAHCTGLSSSLGGTDNVYSYGVAPFCCI